MGQQSTTDSALLLRVQQQAGKVGALVNLHIGAFPYVIVFIGKLALSAFALLPVRQETTGCRASSPAQQLRLVFDAP